MASGVYGKVHISAANTWTEVVAPPTGSDTKVTTLNLCNTDAAATTVQVSISDTAGNAGTSGYLIEFNTALPANGVLERTGIVLSASNGLYVQAANTAVNAVAYGIDG